MTETSETVMCRRNLWHLDDKKPISFTIFVAPIAIFVISIPYLAKKNIPLLFVMIASLGVTLILASLGLFFVGLKADRYVQKHDFPLWKKSKSHSLKDRMEAGRSINAMCMRTPCLEKRMRYANKLAFTLLAIWTLLFVGIFSFVVFSEMWD